MQDDGYVIVVPRQLMDEYEFKKAKQAPKFFEEGSHPCEYPGCAISMEEHHRIAFGYMNELKVLREKVKINAVAASRPK